MGPFERSLDECGPWMYVLLGVAVVAADAIVERWIALFFRHRIRAPLLLDQLEKLIRAGNLDRARKLSHAIGRDVPLDRVVAAGFDHADDGPAAAEGAMTAAAESVRPLIRPGLGALPRLGNLGSPPGGGHVES
ncbi:MAG: hypothetical protein HY907_09985 [Deltaproteobacteria bacterium]|nr:hypothetical protein [Deltaproteobacteria bacterium]